MSDDYKVTYTNDLAAAIRDLAAAIRETKTLPIPQSYYTQYQPLPGKAIPPLAEPFTNCSSNVISTTKATYHF